MKKELNKFLALSCLVLVNVLMFSCEEDDNEKEWGCAKIYMPQASILNGGLTSNDYPVPLNNNAATKNYKLDEEKNLLYVTLGVYRSGLQKLESYSVDVGVDQQSTAAYIADNPDTRALPEDAYILPVKVTVPNSEREATFYLTVDLNKLGSALPDYNIVLDVIISNPSNYELNEDLAKTRVIIDGKVFLP